MEEIVVIDGRQYKLSYDQHINPEQRTQIITQIRKAQSSGIKGLQEPPYGTYTNPFSGCVGLGIMQPGPAITIGGMTIEGVDPGDISVCGCYPGPCDPLDYCNVTVSCAGGICPVEIIWENFGDASGTFTPQVTIDGGDPVTGNPVEITVLAQIDITPGTVMQTFSLSLSPGQHTICIDTGTIT